MSHSIAFSSVPSVDPAWIQEAAHAGVADLHEALGPVAGRACLMSSRMRPLDLRWTVAGQAVTAFNFPGDNLMMHQAIHLAQAGQMLVFSNGGTPTGALLGDLAAQQAKLKGIVGLVADAPVRDVASLIAMEFPVWSTAIHASHTEKRGPGSVNVPVVVDGVLVNPGDVIVGDADGVVVVPLELLPATLEAARARREKEDGIRRRIVAGESLYEVMNMKAAAEAAGLRISAGTWKDQPRDPWSR